MGVWTAAARLGLGLAGVSAKNKISSFSVSLSMRRSSITLAAQEDLGRKKKKYLKSELELNEERSIYLCFNELSRWRLQEQGNHVVRRIRLSSTTKSDDVDDEEEELQVEAYKKSKFIDLYRSSCICTLGSKIITPYNHKSEDKRRHICWIDTSKWPLKFEVSSPTDIKIMSFKAYKYDLQMGEIDGKLYCLNNNMDKDHYSYSFEIFDPEDAVLWQPLDAPPFVRGNFWLDYGAAFLDESKKLLGWMSKIHFSNNTNKYSDVYCFDATKPENGWIELPDPALRNTIPSLYKPLFVHDHHPDIGDFYLIFTYDPTKEPLHLYTFFMSNRFDSFQPINQPIQLPELCSHYLVSKHEEEIYDRGDLLVTPSAATSHFALVHLGPQKVGLVINKYFKNIVENNGIVLLVTFEYDIIVTVEESKPNLEIQT